MNLKIIILNNLFIFIILLFFIYLKKSYIFNKIYRLRYTKRAKIKFNKKIQLKQIISLYLIYYFIFILIIISLIY